jgi:hypothetical protein
VIENYRIGGNILYLLLCISSLISVLRFNNPSFRSKSLITLSIAIALGFLIPSYIYEFSEFLTWFENSACNTIIFFIIPLVIFVRVLNSNPLWIKFLSTTIFILWLLLVSLFWVASQLSTWTVVEKFDSQDGHTYLVELEQTSVGFNEDICMSVKQYKRVLPGVLVYKKSFSDDKKLKKDQFLRDGMWKCRDGNGEPISIAQGWIPRPLGRL